MSDLPPPPPEFEPGSSSQPPPPPPDHGTPMPAPTPAPVWDPDHDPHLAFMSLRSYGAMMALAFFFPIHFFFLRKVGLGIAYWATLLVSWLAFFVPHLIWWFVNLFLVKRWTIAYNNAVLEARHRNSEQ